ncbi:MAG TPA: SapC family protein [Caulobacteraceae bacterium]|jgi:hypothetical protein
MEQTNISGDAALTGSVLFYSKPEPLSREMHGGLGLKQLENPFRFAAQTHVIPLVVTEFAPAALSYPIIFVGEQRMPVAVMGVNQGENLFADEKGVFDVDAYLPAYMRRYPFVFANDESQSRMIVCIDRDAEMITESPETPFFENGEPTEYTKNAIKFCENFETERRRTEAFVKMLKDADMFEVKRATFTPRAPDGTTGEPQLIAEYYAVSETKMAALTGEQLEQFHKTGALSQIYAHFVSLVGWERLIARALMRAQKRVDATSH